MPIKPGLVYRSCDPRGGPSIRIVTVNPNSAEVVDTQTGKRPRRILDKFLHDSPLTKTGQPRRTGYVLETEPTEES